MKYFRKYNLLGQQEQTEIDAFPEYLKGKESIQGRLVMFQIMCTGNTECRQEFDSVEENGPWGVLCTRVPAAKGFWQTDT